MAKTLYVNDGQYLDHNVMKMLLTSRFPSLDVDIASSNQEAIDKSVENPYDIVMYTARMDGPHSHTADMLKCLNPEGLLIGIAGYANGATPAPSYDAIIDSSSLIQRGPLLERILKNQGIEKVEKRARLRT